MASCVQSTTYCSNITGAIPGYTPSAGTLVYNLIEGLNNNNSSVQSAMSSLLSYASSSNPLSLPWTVPATWTSTVSSGGTTSTGSTVAGTTNVFSPDAFYIPDAIAIDSSGNVWVANKGNGTGVVGTASGDSNVTEFSPTGSLKGTYTAGSDPDAIAIGGYGNVWVVSNFNGTVTELVGVATGVKTPLLDQPK